MPVGAAHITHSKIGTCPHGMPQGACPICSGMAGGNSTTKRDVPRNVGEMTYNQCAAIGAMLKAQKAAKQRAHIAEQTRLISLAQFAKTLANLPEKIASLTTQISQTMPAIIAKPVNFVLTHVIARIVNVIPVIAAKFTDISDKLTALIGEAKAAITKTASEIWNKVKKKIKLFFFGGEENEEYKIDEAQKAFKLKTFIHKLAQKLKGNK